MGLTTTARRRWLGALFLLAALLMLLAGETLLKPRLGPLAFLFYWLVCFGLTASALALALLELRALGQRTRQQQRELFETTLRDIENQARQRRSGPAGLNRPNPPPKLDGS
jgi:hypothetical protein